MDINTTLQALDTYAKFQITPHAKGEPKLLLRVGKDGSGQRALRVVSQKDLTIIDKILHFFGLSGLTLRRVVNFLQAMDFGKATLDDKQIRTIEQAMHHLDIKIKKYNNHHFFEIHTKRKNLTITIRELFNRFAEPERAKKARLTLPTPTDEKRLKLQQDILSGRIVAASVQDSALQPYAMVVEAIRKTHNRTMPRSPLVELALVQAIVGAVPSQITVLNKQKEGLIKLLDDEALLAKSPKEVAREIRRTEFLGRLSACRVPRQHHERWLLRFEEILDKKHALSLEYKKQKEELQNEIKSRHLPPIAERSLLNYCEDFARTSMYDHFLKIVTEHADSPAAFDKKVKTPQEIAFAFTEFRDETVLPRIQFFVKWQKNLTQEMKQGFFDRGETLGRGICWALSLRWIKNEMQGSRLIVGKTYGEDRKLQVAYGHVWEGRGGDRMTGLKKLQRGLGIEYKWHAHSDHRVEKKEAIVESLKELGKNKRLQREFNGIGQLEIDWYKAAHAICLVYRKDPQNPNKSTFRFSEPNFGTYEFPVEGRSPEALKLAEEKLCHCLADLISTFYTKELHSLHINCFSKINQKEE